jgi:hypothetical protein
LLNHAQFIYPLPAKQKHILLLTEKSGLCPLQELTSPFEHGTYGTMPSGTFRYGTALYWYGIVLVRHCNLICYLRSLKQRINIPLLLKRLWIFERLGQFLIPGSGFLFQIRFLYFTRTMPCHNVPYRSVTNSIHGTDSKFIRSSTVRYLFLDCWRERVTWPRAGPRRRSVASWRGTPYTEHKINNESTILKHTPLYSKKSFYNQII